MNYKFYPLDLTLCSIGLASYLYDDRLLTLSWISNGSVTIDDGLEIPGFDLFVQKGTTEVFADNYGLNYSYLSFTIALKRRMSYHVIQTYVPSLIFVAICFGSFLIPEESANERIGVALVSLLSLLVMLGSLGQAIPQVTYLTYLHLWMLACIVSVFLSLMEVLVVFKIWSLEKAAKAREGQDRRKGFGVLQDGIPSITRSPKESERLRGISQSLEKIMIIFLIVAFLLFNLVYWPCLLTGDLVDTSNLVEPNDNLNKLAVFAKKSAF